MLPTYATGFVAGSLCALLVVYAHGRRRSRDALLRSPPAVCADVTELIGNTPLLRLQSLSKATGCEILVKVEYLNPGGSSKDRVALNIIRMAEKQHLITPHTNCTITEGTVGSTGISLAMICKAKGYNCHIVMPDDVSHEKVDMLRRLGATVELVRPVSIVDAKQFVNLAKTRAAEFTSAHTSSNGSTTGKGFFADQFENLANFQAHYTTTGPELFIQTGGQLDVFVMGAGTGGTLAGVARYLKPRIPNLKVVLADPEGSGLYNKVKHNIFYTHHEAEGTKRRHQVNTIVEGIGINRLTRNFSMALHDHQDIHMSDSESRVAGIETDSLISRKTVVNRHNVLKWIDDAIHVSDREAVEMARYIMREEGLFIGSSSSVNLVAAVKTAQALGPGQRIVTLLCDNGVRHLTKFWNDDYLQKVNLIPKAQDLEFIHSSPMQRATTF